MWVGCAKRLAHSQTSFGAVLVEGGNGIGAGVVSTTETDVELGGAAVTDKQPVAVGGWADCADPDVGRAVGWVDPPLTGKLRCWSTFADLGDAVISQLGSSNAVVSKERTAKSASCNLAGIKAWNIKEFERDKSDNPHGNG